MMATPVLVAASTKLPSGEMATLRAATGILATTELLVVSMTERPAATPSRSAMYAKGAAHTPQLTPSVHNPLSNDLEKFLQNRLIGSKAGPKPRTRPLGVSRAASPRMCLLIAMLLNPGTECRLPKAMICSMVDVVNRMQHCLFDGLSGLTRKKQSRSGRLPDGTGTASWHPVGSTSTLHGPTGDQKPKGPTWQRQASMCQPSSCWAMDIDNARLVGSRNHRAVANGGSSNASARMAHRTSSRTWRSPRRGPRRSPGHRPRSTPMCR